MRNLFIYEVIRYYPNNRGDEFFNIAIKLSDGSKRVKRVEECLWNLQVWYNDLSIKDNTNKLKDFIFISIRCNIAKYRTFVSEFKVTFIDEEIQGV